MPSLLALNGGAVLVALLAAVAAGLGERTSRLLLGTLSGYLVIVHSLVLAAGLLGWLTPLGLAALLAVAIAAALWLARTRGHGGAADDGGARFTATALFAPLAALAGGVIWTWPHLFAATRLWIWDDYTYHMIYPALWLRAHAIAAATPLQSFTMQAWYPLSASVVSAWFMAPFPGSRGDALAWVSLTGPLYAGIVAAGAAELLARLGCRRGAWALPVVLLVTSKRITTMASSFSDADLALAATLFAALVFAVPRGDVESRNEVLVDAGYAGLLTGIALGVKVSAAVPAMIVALMMALRAGVAAPEARWRARGGVGLIFATAWIATCAYWYARNFVHTGNPVYPAAFLVWPGVKFPETTLVEYSRHYGLTRAVGDALVVYANWPYVHASLAVAGLAALLVWRVRRRPAVTRPRSYFALGALATVAAVLTLLPAMPFSAGNAMTFRAGLVHWDSMRFVGLLPVLGWVALGFLVDAGAGALSWTNVLAALVATAGLLASPLPLPVSAGIALALALGAALLARVRLPGVRLRTARGRALAVGAGALVIAAIVASTHGRKAAATTAALYREPLFGPTISVIDRQPAGTRVAVFGDQWVFPAFGARNDLEPVRVDRDGRLAAAPIGGAMSPGEPTVAPPVFRTNLGASGVSLVVVVHLPHPGRSPAWPRQRAALEAIGDAHLLHRDGAAAVWKLGS